MISNRPWSLAWDRVCFRHPAPAQGVAPGIRFVCEPVERFRCPQSDSDRILLGQGEFAVWRSAFVRRQSGDQTGNGPSGGSEYLGVSRSRKPWRYVAGSQGSRLWAGAQSRELKGPQPASSCCSRLLVTMAFRKRFTTSLSSGSSLITVGLCGLFRK